MNYMIKKALFMAIIVSIASSITVTSCNSSQKNNSETVTIDNEEIKDVDYILLKADSLIGKKVKVEGVCTHICRHGGKKLFLMGSDDNNIIRVDAGKHIGSFPKDVVNNIVVITGTVIEERIDEAYILQMEEQYKQSTLEKHGEDGEAHCAADSKAMRENPSDSFKQRMESFRKKIAERQIKEGKNYLSFYSISSEKYEIQ